MDGLSMYDFLNNEQECIRQVDLMVSYSYYAVNMWTYLKPDYDYLYNSTYSFTRATGTLSPLLRKCYKFNNDNSKQWFLLGERLLNFNALFLAIRQNLIYSPTEID